MDIGSISGIGNFNNIANPVNNKSLISPMKPLKGGAEIENNIPFKDVFEGAIKNVIDTDNKVKENSYLLATGQTDNLYDITIDSTKAQLSISLLVNLRNRAMDAYSEIMRINL